MVLKLIEAHEERIAAQQAFVESLERAWKQRETRVVAWRPDSIEGEIAHNGRFWLRSILLEREDTTPRYWNAFGEYRPAGSLQITVEINIPTESNSDRVAGFFALDEATGTRYLMHDGGVGGGRRGVGRATFLQWSSYKPVPVQSSGGHVRHGLIVSPLQEPKVGLHVGRFVETVAAFKRAVANGEVANASSADVQKSYGDYFKEFSGKKSGVRSREFEYLSRHGDIVHALADWARKAGTGNYRIVKDANIDLGILDSDGRLKELFEVKTNADRYTLYTAIGQLVVHGDGTLRKFLVLPAKELIPKDVKAAADRLSIDVLRFQLNDEDVEIVG